MEWEKNKGFSRGTKFAEVKNVTTKGENAEKGGATVMNLFQESDKATKNLERTPWRYEKTGGKSKVAERRKIKATSDHINKA